MGPGRRGKKIRKKVEKNAKKNQENKERKKKTEKKRGGAARWRNPSLLSAIAGVKV